MNLRTPFLQGDINNRARWGRDHHPYAYTAWMAGGGVKPGISYGQTDDLGINVAEDPVHVHDFQQRCFIYWELTTNALLSDSKADVSVSPTYMEKSSRNC